MGLSSSRKPERDILIAELSASIAGSWPKIVSFRSRSSVRRDLRSDAETLFAGILAIFATIFSTISTVTRSLRSSAGRSLRFAPASSMTSIALSGSRRSLMCFADSSAAAMSACDSYRTP